MSENPTDVGEAFRAVLDAIRKERAECVARIEYLDAMLGRAVPPYVRPKRARVRIDSDTKTSKVLGWLLSHGAPASVTEINIGIGGTDDEVSVRRLSALLSNMVFRGDPRIRRLERGKYVAADEAPTIAQP